MRTLPGLAGRSDICIPVHSARLSPEKPGLPQSLGASTATVFVSLAAIEASAVADVPVLADGNHLTLLLTYRSGPYGSASKRRSLSVACRRESLFLELSGVHGDCIQVTYFSRFHQIVQSIHILFEDARHSQR